VSTARPATSMIAEIAAADSVDSPMPALGGAGPFAEASPRTLNLQPEQACF
jgi:hypothetical protein